MFSAQPGENALDWLERYELTGRYNQWDEDELRTNFVRDRTKVIWFSNFPSDWDNQTAVAATAIAAAIPFVAGLRIVFLQEIWQDNFALIKEAEF